MSRRSKPDRLAALFLRGTFAFASMQVCKGTQWKDDTRNLNALAELRLGNAQIESHESELLLRSKVNLNVVNLIGTRETRNKQRNCEGLLMVVNQAGLILPKLIYLNVMCCSIVIVSVPTVQYPFCGMC